MGEVNGGIFLREPLAAQPREPDTSALVRTFGVHQVPCATTETRTRLALEGPHPGSRWLLLARKAWTSCASAWPSASRRRL